MQGKKSFFYNKETMLKKIRMPGNNTTIFSSRRKLYDKYLTVIDVNNSQGCPTLI